MASNQWALITSSNTRNNWPSCGNRKGVLWKKTGYLELKSIARCSGWWHPWVISRPNWCFDKWVNGFNQTIQWISCRESWCPITQGWKPYKTHRGKAGGVDCVAIDLPTTTTSHITNTNHPISKRVVRWWITRKNKQWLLKTASRSGNGSETFNPLWSRWVPSLMQHVKKQQSPGPCEGMSSLMPWFSIHRSGSERGMLLKRAFPV